MSTATQVVEEYKDFEAFVNDAVEAKKDAYFFRFDNCKKMVAKAYPTLDLNGILISGGEEATMKEEKEGIVEEEGKATRERVAKEASADEGLIEVPALRQLQPMLSRKWLPL